MRIELTIKVDYLPTWGMQEGVRELLQNARDAQTELAATMSVRHRAPDTLVIENDGCTLPYEALLLGHTSKASRGDLIGKFGEGFKLGILALLRAGHAVKIRNGSEVWIPAIESSQTFAGASVLVFNISKGRKPTDRVSVEIDGISVETYRDDIRPRFLWLDTDGRRRDDTINTPAGTLLLSERYKGRVYVKGIFVERKPSLTVGYDLSDADVDRDRRMISSYDFAWKTRQIWNEALGSRPDLFKCYADILTDNGPEAQGFDSYDARRLPEAFTDHVASQFRTQHGDKALPVSNMAESADIEHYGRKGVVVSAPLRAALEQKLGPLADVQASLKTEVTHTYSWHDLTQDERDNLTRAARLTGAPMPDVVDFRSPTLMGTYQSGEIKLARRVVASRSECLATLVHEHAHNHGADGDHAHVAEIERLWSKIVADLDPK